MGSMISLRATDDLFERVEAAVGRRGRSEFIRSAIEAALAARGDVKPLDEPAKRVSEDLVKKAVAVRESEPVVKPEVNAGRWDADKATLMGEMGSGPVLPRKLADRLGWAPAKVDKVAGMLVADGKVSFAGGVLEAVRG